MSKLTFGFASFAGCSARRFRVVTLVISIVLVAVVLLVT